MNNIILFVTNLIFCIAANAQDFKGRWSGLLDVNGTPLRLHFTIAETDGLYSAEMSSPDQNVYGIPVSRVVVDRLKLALEITEMGITYEGLLEKNEIKGTFKQGNLEVAMHLKQLDIDNQEVARYQTPQPPYNYLIEDVTFFNESANIRLAGTLTLPKKKGKFPIAILISGSGPQNRDEEVFGHKPFLVIADYLTARGIGVLRFDDRGIGNSEGNFGLATTGDFATDVESAIVYLRSRSDVNSSKIGLIGHSEGAVIAPMVAAKDKRIKFLVMLAGFGLSGDSILLKQQETIAQLLQVGEADIVASLDLNRKLFNAIKDYPEPEAPKRELYALISSYYATHPLPNLPVGVTKDLFFKQQVDGITTPWMLGFIRLDPALFLKQIDCPVLVLNGGKDIQVDATENVQAIRNALPKAKSKMVSKIYPELNHLFQTCETGMMDEYATLEETISLQVLSDLYQWIQKKS